MTQELEINRFKVISESISFMKLNNDISENSFENRLRIVKYGNHLKLYKFPQRYFAYKNSKGGQGTSKLHKNWRIPYFDIALSENKLKIVRKPIQEAEKFREFQPIYKTALSGKRVKVLVSEILKNLWEII